MKQILITRRSAVVLVSTICSALLFVSCEKQDNIVPIGGNDEISEVNVPEGSRIVLGKQLENPYSVENMKRALKNLQESNVGGITAGSDLEIETTNLYVRFLPADTTELNLLASDTTIELYDHPLDFEITQIGNWYHDPTLPDSAVTWQYTVVEPDYEFPAVLISNPCRSVPS